MRLELELGPLLIVFDPYPAEDADEDEIQAITSTDATSERRDDHGNPELHMGFRGGYYED